MRSAGNDIVAMQAVDKQRTHHSRFYSKILSATERTLYDRLPSAGMLFENFVWLSWSVKESVYKYLKRAAPGLVFSPTRIIIQNIDLTDAGHGGPNDPSAHSGQALYKGMAVFGSYSLYFQSVIHAEFIATTVNGEKNFKNIWWGIKRVAAADHTHQSAAVRTFALDRLYGLLSEDKEELFENKDGMRGNRENLRIEKNSQGCPVIWRGAKETDIPLSLAHHDYFVSYAFYFNKEGRSVIS